MKKRMLREVNGNDDVGRKGHPGKGNALRAGSPLSDSAKVIFSAFGHSIFAAAGVIAMEMNGKRAVPEQVGLYPYSNEVHCMYLPFMRNGLSELRRFHAAELAVSILSFGANSRYDDEYLPYVNGVAEDLKGRIDDLFDLARALFMNGVLKRNEIKSLIRKRSDGGGDGGAPSHVAVDGEKSPKSPKR